MLVVDDDTSLALSLRRVLQAQGFLVGVAFDGASALENLRGGLYDVMVLDLQLGDEDGLDVFRACMTLPSPPATILHSAYLDVRTTVLAVRSGIGEVMEKPVPENVLAVRIHELTKVRRSNLTQTRAVPPPVVDLSSDGVLGRIVGESPAIVLLREQVQRVVAFRDLSVLIHGETGTGKEVVAEAIHRLSSPDEPFVSINCATLPEHLFESELFGHESGSFTSARGARPGLLEEAGRGTIFLDEVGEMPLGLQAKMLRVLETRQFRRVGANRARSLFARVVSATNRPIQEGRRDALRPDLYFRLAGYTISTPELAARASDIPLLVRHFLDQFARRHRLATVEISASAVGLLQALPWPGNVRELRAVVENAGILATAGVIHRADVERVIESRRGVALVQSGGPESTPSVPAVPGAPAVPEVLPAETALLPSLPDVQRDLILRAFIRSDRNLSQAARELGIPRSTLRDRLRRYGVR